MKNLARILLFSMISVSFGLIYSCKEQKPPENMGLKEGPWRGNIVAQGNDIPFNFQVVKNQGQFLIELVNGDEKLQIDDVNILGDSLFFSLHIFDISVRARMQDSILSGTYTKNYAKDYVLPFSAAYGKTGRFDDKSASNSFDGTWETVFKTEEGREIPAIGIFKEENDVLKGTFLTKTGDYRYLDGYTEKDTMHLFTFDGNHIYKFKAYKENDSLIRGEFWSGKTSYKTFESRRNAQAKLPDATSLTYLKEGYDKIEFSFPGLDGNPVTLSDPKFKDKVVVLQILGTWCPNCMDETRFLSQWYRTNQDADVEILGLAYEVKPDFDYAKKRVETMKDKLKVPYDFVIAGTSTTQSASESLPMLNKVMSFPTTIILDKKGEVRRIHTGFSGPATGEHYESFVEDFNEFMKGLLEES